MNNVGIFSGLWAGVSNTIANGMAFTSHQRDIKTGETEKNREAQIALATLQNQMSDSRNKLYITIGVIALVIIVVVVTRKK